MTTRRIQWIDICKGLAIFLVVLGHTLRNNVSYIYIYSFHMPLFFFLSGLVLNREKYTLKSFVVNRFNTLIVPYVFFYLSTYVYWLLVERSFRSFQMEWYKPLFGMIYAGQFGDLMAHNGILWFLPCLFVAEIIFFIVTFINNKKLQLILVVLISLIGSQIKIVLPWCLNIAMCALIFLYTGYICKDKIQTKLEMKNNTIWRVFSLFTILYMLTCTFFPNRIAMAGNIYNNILLFYVTAFLGIAMLTSFSVIINYYSNNSLNYKALLYLGCNTLIIFALHQPVLRIISFIGKSIFVDFPIETNLLLAIGGDIVIILCLLPLIKLYKRFVEPLFRKCLYIN